MTYVYDFCKRRSICSSLIETVSWIERSDTQLPQSRADGQGQFLRSLEHLGSEANDRKNIFFIFSFFFLVSGPYALAFR